MKRSTPATPYATATSGAAAREDITRLLRRFGCESAGFLGDFGANEVTLGFLHRGRRVQLRVSANGWAALFLKEQPWSARRYADRRDYEAAACRQGLIAVNSILRDWLKGQITAVECGVLSFDAVFMPYMLLADGSRLIDRVIEQKLLPAPTGEAA